MVIYEDILSFWKEYDIQNSDQLDAMLDSQRVLFAYHSGKIENEQINYYDTREIFDKDGVISYTGDLRTLFEIRNQKDAYRYLLGLYDEKPDVTEEILLRFHYELTKNTYDERRWSLGERPGSYKKHDFVTGRDEVGAAPEDVREEVNELLSDMTVLDASNVLKGAAFFQCKIENIHPFADGNGRVGRLVSNYYLLKHGHPPITIHEEDRYAYYRCLEAFDRDLSIEEMVSFMKDQTVKTWDKQAGRARSIGRYRSNGEGR